MPHSREHITVTWRASGEATLTLSSVMRQRLGEPVRFRFRGPGSDVSSGEPFGRAEGSSSTCNLYAPFALTITKTAPDHVEVRGTPQPSDELLDETAYASYTAVQVQTNS